MPSNQYRPLTKPYPKGSAHRDQVATLNRGLTIFAAIYLVVAFLSTLTQPSTSRCVANAGMSLTICERLIS